MNRFSDSELPAEASEGSVDASPTPAAADLFGGREDTVSEPPLVRQRTRVLRELVQLALDRNRDSEAADAEYKGAGAAANKELAETQQAIQDEFNSAKTTAEAEFAKNRQSTTALFLSQYSAREQEYHSIRDQASAQFNAGRARAKQELTETRWECTTVYDATKHVPKRELKEIQRQAKSRMDRLAEIAQSFYTVLLDYRQPRQPLEMAEEDQGPTVWAEERLETPAERLQQCISEAEEQLAQLQALKVPGVFKGFSPLWLLVVVAGAIVYGVGWLTHWHTVAVSASVVSTVSAILMLTIWLYLLAKKQVDEVYDPFCQTLANAGRARDQWLNDSLAAARQRQAEIRAKHRAELSRAGEAYQQQVEELRISRDKQFKEADEKFVPLLAEMKRQHEERLRQIDEKYPRATVENVQSRDDRLHQAQDRHDRRCKEIKDRYTSLKKAVLANWQQGIQRLQTSVTDINRQSSKLFPDWNDASWDAWVPPGSVSGVIHFGQFHGRLDQVLGSAADAGKFEGDPPPSFSLPALLSFPDRGSLLLKTSGAGRIQAVQTIQAVMLRYLTSLPPGKVRFTIIDPVGLGQNFAGFMHLADYDEKLVTSRIWSEPQFIEKRLSDITVHMANVIQKYLRNEFETIEEYNMHAGEVAEPFRVLVVANFPFNFSEAAARHLLSIVTTGSRCGVYTLISVDMKQRLPHGFNIVDLEPNSIKLVWKEGRFTCRDGAWENLDLELDQPPEPDRFTQIVHLVGEGAKDSSRVEVPFEFIAPPPEKWWTGDSRGGVDIALGRCGATKRQHLQLGKGTSQHVLIAGKTGSGKSTLLHALVTNLALLYSPEEVELYLVDFKKGVEFKTYAVHELPHARVVAIESEREFGLSVLERLDAEMKERGDRFRNLGVQDVRAYRQATGLALPRILLIVDEFQEFFIEDDRIAQDASLLLDRLVRQGRAFGMHVHLGSQTLGGAYSLARTTIGQMAVRIALQCSEADAHLILSEDNPAARLLARPGEAIYNDANGRVEGNNLFQVVWLSEERREDYLVRIRELARKRNFQPPQPQIVFEGNVPADLGKNYLLERLLCDPAWPEPLPAVDAWLGEAIAIKDPTAVVFRRQSGCHAVIIGQQAEAALAMTTVALVGVAAQRGPDPASGAAGACFYFLDGTPPDAPHCGYLKRLADVLPQPVKAGGVRDAAEIVAEVAAEVDRRQNHSQTDASDVYLVIFDLQRFRELRRQEDDYGFSRAEEKLSPSKQLAAILREGPPLGVHVIVWCDTLNNLNRAFDRQTLREFENRVLFQMSQTDSSNLIDSPLASRLGPHRAMLYSEEQGQLEKFRPYSLPTRQWLARVRQQLHAKTAAQGGQSQSAEPANA